MATRRDEQTRGGRRAPGRAPGVYRTAGNPLYRTDPRTGNLVLANEFEVIDEPRPLPPAPPRAPVVEEAPREEAPSPLFTVFADGPSAESEPPGSAPGALGSAEAEAGGAAENTASAGSRTSGRGAQMGAMAGAAVAGIPGMVLGALAGEVIEGQIAGQPSASGAGARAPTQASVPNQPRQDLPEEPPKETPVAIEAPGTEDGDDSAPGPSDSKDSSAPDSGSKDNASGDSPDAGGGGSNDADAGGFYQGGFVTPDRLRGPDPAGPDDGAADLDVGEFVVNAQAAQQNMGLLEAINAQPGLQGAPDVVTMHWFFGNVLPRTPEGRQLIADYEEVGPAIEQALAQRPDGVQVLQRIVRSYIQPAAEAVRRGDYAGAVHLYGEMGTEAAQLAAESELDSEIEQKLEEFAQDSAEIAHDGELARLASSPGNQLVHPGDQVAAQPMSRLGRIFVGG